VLLFEQEKINDLARTEKNECLFCIPRHIFAEVDVLLQKKIGNLRTGEIIFAKKRDKSR